ncbi:MAG: hypothetical protein HZA94_03715 [Candidatus Vogelbacteria bacterium]|nr:hypothetical protein [Candidatus Vogelbacteria bacterium]
MTSRDDLIVGEFQESLMLFQASWVASGRPKAGLDMRYYQTGQYCSFLFYQDPKSGPADFSREHIFVARYDFCDRKIMQGTRRVKKYPGVGILIHAEAGGDSTFVVGLPLADLAVYLRALYLCLMDKGDVPLVDSSLVRIDKKFNEYRGRKAVFLIVVNSDTGEPTWSIPRAIIFVDEMDEDAQDLVAQFAEAEDYEPTDEGERSK